LVNYNKDRVSVIALEAGFVPLVGDLVIGEVTDIELGQWKVDIGAEKDAILTINDAIGKPYRTYQDMPKILDVGDTVVAKIVDLDRSRTPILSIMGRELGKVREGFIIKITPSKIPRLIGKKGSMINMILKESRCQVTIGQNGKILINGRNREDEELVVKVINKIEAEAHTSGLTNRIQEYFKELRDRAEYLIKDTETIDDQRYMKQWIMLADILQAIHHTLKHADSDWNFVRQKLEHEILIVEEEKTDVTVSYQGKMDLKAFKQFWKFIPDAINVLLIEIKEDSESDFQELAEIWYFTDAEYDMIATTIFRFIEMYYPQFLEFMASNSFFGLILMVIPVAVMLFNKVKKSLQFHKKYKKLKADGLLKSQQNKPEIGEDEDGENTN